MITEYTEICILCGRLATDKHHLLNGRDRQKCDEDGIIIPLCNVCHREIHKNAICEKLCKIAGQLAWEKDFYKNGNSGNAREKFRIRYKSSYI
jgi:hypothetical protein